MLQQRLRGEDLLPASPRRGLRPGPGYKIERPDRRHHTPIQLPAPGHPPRGPPSRCCSGGFEEKILLPASPQHAGREEGRGERNRKRQAAAGRDQSPNGPRSRLRPQTRKKVRPCDLTLKRRLPTLPRENRSTIGVSELNFSVRNGKRWNLTAITT